MEKALPLEKEERPSSVGQWWSDAVSALSVSSSGDVRTLRGYFVLPELKAQGMVRRLGRGRINDVIPLNDELVVVCATSGAALFDLRTDEALWEIDCPAAGCGAVSADGTLLALVSERDIYLWDLTTGNFLRQIRGHTEKVNSVAFSPNGRTLASGSHDKTVRLFDVASGSELRQFQGHTELVNSIAFSPDGRTIASGSHDRTLRLFDVASGRELRQFQGHRDYVNSVAFSPDGKFLVSGGDVMRLWEL